MPSTRLSRQDCNGASTVLGLASRRSPTGIAYAIVQCAIVNRRTLSPAADARAAATARPQVGGQPEHDPDRRRTCREPHGAGVVPRTVRVPQGAAGRARCAAAAALARQVLLVRVGRRRRVGRTRAERPRHARAPLRRPALRRRCGARPGVDRGRGRLGRPGQPRAVGRRTAGRPTSRPDCRSRCCPASAPSPAGASSRWPTAARVAACCSAWLRSSWPCTASCGSPRSRLLACVVFDGLDGGAGPQVRRGQPVRRADGLAGRPELVRRRRRHRGLRRGWPASAPRRSPPARPAPCVAACAAIRLARFNVSPKDGRFFCGVPTTMAAAVLALAVADRACPAGHRRRSPAVALLAFAMVLQLPVRQAGPAGRSCRRGCGCVPVIGALVDVRLTFAADRRRLPGQRPAALAAPAPPAGLTHRLTATNGRAAADQRTPAFSPAGSISAERSAPAGDDGLRRRRPCRRGRPAARPRRPAGRRRYASRTGSGRTARPGPAARRPARAARSGGRSGRCAGPPTTVPRAVSSTVYAATLCSAAGFIALAKPPSTTK